MSRINEKPSKGNRNAIQGAFSWRSNDTAITPLTWGEVDADTIRGAVDAISRGGGAVMLGLTSDGGAYSVCVLSGEDKVKEYPHSVSECQELLRSLMDHFVNL